MHYCHIAALLLSVGYPTVWYHLGKWREQSQMLNSLESTMGRGGVVWPTLTTDHPLRLKELRWHWTIRKSQAFGISKEPIFCICFQAIEGCGNMLFPEPHNLISKPKILRTFGANQEPCHQKTHCEIARAESMLRMSAFEIILVIWIQLHQLIGSFAIVCLQPRSET